MITYEPLWQTLENRNITKYKLVKKLGVQQTTITRMQKNLPITTTTLDLLCEILDCNVEDIILYKKSN